MSLEPTFNSSMFPVIMFDNAAVTAYSLGLLTLLWLKRKGDPRFQHLFPATEQIHLGSLLLAFTLAWTYFNFSQFMLIWIGNLPEEIPYYLKRTREGWGWYAALAVVFHFPIPFLLLLFRRVKSNPVALRNIAIMLVADRVHRRDVVDRPVHEPRRRSPSSTGSWTWPRPSASGACGWPPTTGT